MIDPYYNTMRACGPRLEHIVIDHRTGIPQVLCLSLADAQETAELLNRWVAEMAS